MKTIQLRKTPTLSETLARLGEQYKDAAASYGAGTVRKWLRGKAYRLKPVDKKDGTTRATYAPSKELKAVQRSLIPMFRQFEPKTQESHGFRPKRSNKTAADAIRKSMLAGGKYTIIGCDLEKAFPSITAKQVLEIIKRFIPEWSSWKKHAVTRILTRKGTLATGAPSSPTILNLFLIEMDEELTKLARRYGGRYVRYADDLVLSIGSHKLETIREVEKELWRIIKLFKMKPHPKKHFRKRLNIDSEVAEVVGIQLNPAETRPKRYHLRKLRAWKFRGEAEERTDPGTWNGGKYDPDDWVKGRFYWRERRDGLIRYMRYITSNRQKKDKIALAIA